MTSTCSCDRGVMGEPKEQACWVTRMGEKEAGTEPDRETNEKQFTVQPLQPKRTIATGKVTLCERPECNMI